MLIGGLSSLTETQNNIFTPTVGELCTVRAHPTWNVALALHYMMKNSMTIT